jgi:hypothetical protein
MLYDVRVTFTVEGDHYGQERYRVRAASAEGARCQALELSNRSVLADERIDYVREVVVLDEVKEE